MSLQWAGVKAYERESFLVPETAGTLMREESSAHRDFTVSLLTAQVRYRWEIAPLTDFYVVYNRGNQLPAGSEDAFGDLFSQAFQDPVVNSLVIKLRYRWGS